MASHCPQYRRTRRLSLSGGCSWPEDWLKHDGCRLIETTAEGRHSRSSGRIRCKNMKIPPFDSLLIGLVACSTITACNDRVTTESQPVEIYPAAISDSCRGGVAKIYDECSDQAMILQQARQSAAASGKSVLIVYGAEWCIWCHVFEKYIQGQSRKFTYEFEYEEEPHYWPMRERENKDAEAQARQLNAYVADNFVIANIEGHYSPNGVEVLANVGYDTSSLSFYPLFVVLNNEGKYVSSMQSVDLISGLEIRVDSGEEYRGYDRAILLRELQKLRQVSVAGSEG